MSRHTKLALKNPVSAQTIYSRQTKGISDLRGIIVRFTIKTQINFILIVALLSYPIINFGQAIYLGTAANYVLYTTTGAIATAGACNVSGNIGTTAGAISALSNIDGVIHNGDATSLVVSTDVLNIYHQLNARIATSFPPAILGYGQTYLPGVYSIASAASLSECITFDARGDSNALFIFHIQGAFVTGPSAKVCLINGALTSNVFWKVEGAISMGAGTFMKGTMVANNGAIAMASGDSLEGRALSTAGAIAIDRTTVSLPKSGRGILTTGPSAPNLRSTIYYSIFSTNGLLNDDGSSSVVGEIGTNVGSITGYHPSHVSDSIHLSADPSTTLCANDLMLVYQYLDTLTHDIDLLYPAELGNNLVLTPHVYLMNSAAILSNDLILNAEGNENAVFVIKINGALTTTVAAQIKLINKAQSKNVFWLIHGALSININSNFKGMVICDHAAIVLNAGVKLDGTLFSTTGNITTNSDTISNVSVLSTNLPIHACVCPMLSVLPIELLSFSVDCRNDLIELVWNTASEINNDYFSIEKSIDGDSWQLIAKIKAAGNSTSFQRYSISDPAPYKKNLYYRLKQTDFDGNFKYSASIVLNNCKEKFSEINVFPNPTNKVLNISYGEEVSEIVEIAIFDVSGKMIKTQTLTPTTISLENLINGVYFLYVNLGAKTFLKEFVVLNK